MNNYFNQSPYQNTNIHYNQQSFYLEKGLKAFHDLMDAMQNLDIDNQQLLACICAVKLINQKIGAPCTQR